MRHTWTEQYFFKLKGRTVSHTFRPRRRCVRQPWPAGEDLPAESLLPEAQRRRSRVHGDQTFLDLRLKWFHSFFAVVMPSVNSQLRFDLFWFVLGFFFVTTKTLWCFTIRLPVLVQGFRDSTWWCIPRRAHRASLTLGLLARSRASRRLHSCPQTAERRDVKSLKTEHTYFWSVGGYFWNK